MNRDTDLFTRADILKVLRTEYQYWIDVTDPKIEFEAGIAAGVVANLLAFFEVDCVAEWHPKDVKPVFPEITEFLAKQLLVNQLLRERIPPLAEKWNMPLEQFWRHGAKAHPTAAAMEWHACLQQIAGEAGVTPAAVSAYGWKLFKVTYDAAT